MDASCTGLLLDQSKLSSLTLDEKRDIIHQVSKSSQDPSILLQSWSRRDLLEVLCFEMGKERKYTGVTKLKLIENLLRIISEKRSGRQVGDGLSTSPKDIQGSFKRQKKDEHYSNLPGETNAEDVMKNDTVIAGTLIFCQNLACRATVRLEDAFCRRCSCCICYKYDDNKDPSLWLVCSTDLSTEGDSCGMSCHVECAVKHEKTAIAKSKDGPRLDGSFYCVHCGKINDLLRCWRKQLLIAKDARRVDVLYYRLSLSHKLLNGTEKHQILHEIVDEALKKLESDVGPLDSSTIMARSIVNRLSSGAEVQKLCLRAVELLDAMHSSVSQLSSKREKDKTRLISLTSIKFEEIFSTSLEVVISLKDDAPVSEEVVYTSWYRKVDDAYYSTQPIFKMQKPNQRYLVSELSPAEKYIFKVVAHCDGKEIGMWEVGVETKGIVEDDLRSRVVQCSLPKPNCSSPKTNISSLSEESNNTTTCGDLNKLPDECLDSSNLPETTDLIKSSCKKKTDLIKSVDKEANLSLDTRVEVVAQERSPWYPVPFLDEVPMSLCRDLTNSTIRTALCKDFINSDAHDPLLDTQKSLTEDSMAATPLLQLETVLPVTPSKLEANKEIPVRNCSSLKVSNGFECDSPMSSKEKKSPAMEKPLHNKERSPEQDYEYCVKVVRWLECTGHIETNFRVKFLTWFSLRAMPQERRVVSVFVDTLIDDPPSLAGQLVDAFSEGLSNKRPPAMTNGFCTRLFH